MALTKLTTDLIDGSLGTDWQTTPKTANFTAVAGEGYFVNTTSATITITLPSSPTAGDELTIVDYAGTADTNNITITSSDNINGATNNVVINYERGGVSIVYVDATQGWIAYNAANESDSALALPSFALDYLIVAGGGSGGMAHTGGGGGGAGGLLTNYSGTALMLNVNTDYSVTVGAGGASVPGNQSDTTGNNGTNSIFSSITTTGGGGGAAWNAGGVANNGGSGGGGEYSGSAGSGTTGQGNDGGSGANLQQYGAGGGGGAGTVGSNGTTTQGGNGGGGLQVNIIGGTGNYYAGGGGGGTYNSGPGGNGGAGGGGAAGTAAAGTAGTPNTGGGGGGNGNTQITPIYSSGAGGSGTVILRYSNSYTITNPGSGLTFTTATVGSDKVTTFTAGTGNIQFN
jgi:hypothetical protein